MEPVFFANSAKLRAWLAKNAAKQSELLVGVHKKASGTPSITWPELVGEILCFGWIDGIRRSLGDAAYTIRITPRRPRSIWSAVNIKLVEKLRKEGRMTSAGEKAFAARDDKRSGIYAFEQKTVALDPARRKRFAADKAAWKWYTGQPAGYQKVTTWYVMSAKKEETRDRRLGHVMAHAARGERIPQALGPPKRASRKAS